MAREFCYFYIRQPIEAFVGIWLFIGVSLMLYKASRQLYDISHMDVISKIIKGMYAIVFLWGIIYIAKIVVSEMLFWGYSDQKDQKDKFDKETLLNYSVSVFVLDVAGAYCIQSVLILTSYNMNLQLVLSQAQQNEEVITQNTENSHREGSIITTQKKENNDFLKRPLKVLQIYRVIRVILAIGVIAGGIIYAGKYRNAVKLTIWASITLGLLVFESTWVLANVCIAFRQIRYNQKLENFCSEDQLKQIIKQYKIFILCSCIRLIVLTSFFSFFINGQIIGNEQEQKINCSILFTNEDSTSTIKKGIIRLLRDLNVIGEGFFMHLIPVYLCLRQFKIKKADCELNASLIIADGGQSGQNFTESDVK